MRRLATVPAPLLVIGGVLVAVLVNLVGYLIGVAAGGGFRFSAPTGPARVDAATVAGFTAVPLTIGLVLAAVIGRWWPAVFRIALVVAPVLAVGTIFAMTVPSDLDPVAKVTLAVCHLTLVPISVLVLAALRRRRLAQHPVAAAGPAPASGRLGD